MRFPFFVSALLAVLQSSEAATELTDSNIFEAKDLWISDPSNATVQYGNITSWDTPNITSMQSLFSGKTDFNDDISKWDVASVTTTR